ncbi:MAG: HNH endonuclease [Deltaproteobacteria bacterium]|nr:HNH endonuclease [Deltaproteobacteria bacterium]
MIDVERSQPAPESLAAKTTHRGPDTVDRLSEDFLGKCYLCETYVGRASFHIDHRRPKAEFPELRYDWNNLFPACEFCNEARPRTWPQGGLIDPAAGENATGRLNQRLVGRKCKPCFEARDLGDTAAVNTASELNKIHQRSGPKGADLRAVIDQQLRQVLESIVKYQDTQTIDDKMEVKELLSRRAPFTALIRSRVLDRLPNLAELMD